jgi:hypothetical protein
MDWHLFGGKSNSKSSASSLLTQSDSLRFLPFLKTQKYSEERLIWGWRWISWQCDGFFEWNIFTKTWNRFDKQLIKLDWCINPRREYYDWGIALNEVSIQIPLSGLHIKIIWNIWDKCFRASRECQLVWTNVLQRLYMAENNWTYCRQLVHTVVKTFCSLLSFCFQNLIEI